MSTILDPLETLRIVNNTAAPMEMRSDALEALADMIAVGIPVHYSAGLVRDIPEDETGSPMNTLAAAVNAALANDDKSGLEGIETRSKTTSPIHSPIISVMRLNGAHP